MSYRSVADYVRHIVHYAGFAGCDGLSNAGPMLSRMIEDRKALKHDSSDNVYEGWILWFIGIVIVALIVPIAVAAKVIVDKTAHLFSRGHYAILGAFGFLILALGWPWSVNQYVIGVKNAIFGSDTHGRFSMEFLPLPFLLGATLLFVGLWGAVLQRFDVLHAVTSKLTTPLFGGRSVLDNQRSVMPSDNEIAKLGGASPEDLERILAKAEDSEPGFVIGVDQNRTPIRITEKEIATHMLLFGSTGSGKSVSLQAIAGGLLDLGWSGLILDLKEDAGGLGNWCETYAKSHGIDYQQLALSDPNPDFWFDALDGLDIDLVRDALLSLAEFDDAYYKEISIKVLQQTLNLVFWAHALDPKAFPVPTLYNIAALLGSKDLPDATRLMRGRLVNETDAEWDDFDALAVVKHIIPTDEQRAQGKKERFVDTQPDKVFLTQAASMSAKLGNLFATQAGRTVLRDAPGRQRLDVTKPGLAYVGLDSTGKTMLSKVVSASMLQRIAADAAIRTINKDSGPVTKRFVIVDEASIVDRNIVHALLSKARSAGIAVILATQGPLDWRSKKEGDDFARLSQNTNVALIMSQGEPESATVCAEFIGQENRLQANLKYADGAVTDGGSVRESREYIVDPDELRALQVGQGILRIGKPRLHVHWVKVIQRDPTAGGTAHEDIPTDTPGSSLLSSPALRPSTPGIARPPS